MRRHRSTDPKPHPTYVYTEPLPSSPCKWNWTTGTKRIRLMLGFETTKMPRDFHGRFKVDGWNVVVKKGAKKGSRKSSKHRIFIDFGGKEVPAGRVKQALCPRTLLYARKKAADMRWKGGRFTYEASAPRGLVRPL